MPAPTKPQKSPDANVEKVVDLMRSRSVIGLEKYKVTTERTDLTPLEWVRHWQAENADATIYAEKLVDVLTRLEGKNLALMSREVHLTDELSVLRKTVESARDSVRDLAVLWLDQDGVVTSGQIIALAETVGAELPAPSKAVRAADVAPKSAPAIRVGLITRHSSPATHKTPLAETWHDAQTTPPDVGHAVIGMVNGTTKTRAVYYVAKTGKWVDVNDRPVTVSQWRHL